MAFDKLVYQISANATGFTRELKKAETAFDRFQRHNQRGLKQLGDAGMLAAKGVAALTAAAGAAAVALSVKATKAAAGFERAIVSAGARVNATSEQLKQMEVAAVKAAAGAEFSARQAADAMGFLAAAGFNVTEQMSALPNVLNLASAGEMDLAQSADLASNVLAQFALDVEELGRVNDVLVKSANSANTSVYQLGEALSYSGPAAKGAGISIEETVAALSKLSDAGIQGDRAGTGFTQIMIQMRKAAKKMGVELSGADIASLGFAGSLEKLTEAGLTAQNAGEFFTSRAQVAVQALLVQGIPAIKELDAALQQAGGTAQEVADKKIDTLQGSINILEGNIDNMLITLGQKFAPAVKSLADSFSEFSIELRENDALLQGFADAMAGMISVMGGVTQSMGLAARAAIRIGATLSGNFTKGKEAAQRLEDSIDGMTDRMAQFAAQIKAGAPGLTDLHRSLLEIDEALRAGNLTIAERIRLEQKLQKTQQAIRIQELESRAAMSDALEQETEQLSNRLIDLQERQERLRALAAQAGLTPTHLNQVAPLRIEGLDDETNANIRKFQQAWLETSHEISATKNNLEQVEIAARDAWRAQDELAKINKPAFAPTPEASRKAGQTSAEAFSAGADAVLTAESEKHRERAIRDAESQAKGVVSSFKRILKEADENDIWAGYARMRFEQENAQRQAAMQRALEEQQAIAERWARVWESAGLRIGDAFASTVGDAFLGVLEGNVNAVADAFKSLTKELIILGTKMAVLSIFDGTSGGGILQRALGFADGGYVSGPGTGTSDSIPAYLSNGEYVVRQRAVQHWGEGFLDDINQMKTPSRRQKFASGGAVGRSSASGVGGGGDIRIVNVTDPSEIEAVMASAAGERVFINTISRRSDEIKRILA